MVIDKKSIELALSQEVQVAGGLNVKQGTSLGYSAVT